MKCPQDDSEMIKGMIHDGLWYQGGWPRLSKAITKVITLKSRINVYIVAWRCPHCGKIELSSEI